MFTSRASRNRGILLAVPLALMFASGFIAGCPTTPPDGMNNGEPNTPADNTDKNSGVTGKYIGSERCATCHNHTHIHWSMTLHGSALKTLEDIGQGDNPSCLPCHTVGYGEDGGYVSRDTTADLANVGCEDCHGAARAHAENVADATLRPPLPLDAKSTCGKCHTDSHHPNYDEWKTSRHAKVTAHVADGLVAGERVASCGICHSGEVFVKTNVLNEDVSPTEFLGDDPNTLVAVTCVVCHDPHMQTGNAPEPGDGRDFQLRYAEIANPIPSNTTSAATDATRFNLCGQCHHSRGTDWTATSRGPHHSVQSNIYVGEMATPDSEEDGTPLVASISSVHLRASEQCATCHLYRQDFMDEEAPAIAGHTFQVNYLGCVAAGCHTSEGEITTRAGTFMDCVQSRLDGIAAALGDPADWQYSTAGGPSDQSMVSDDVKKARFLMTYIANDGSLGIHNPGYVEAMLDEAERLAGTTIGNCRS